MGETSCADKKRESNGDENQSSRSKRSRRTMKTTRCVPHGIPPLGKQLQKLYCTCKEVFNGGPKIPSPHNIERLQNILDDMRPEDFGLRRDSPFLMPRSVVKESPSIQFNTIYYGKSFSLCMFFLPPNAVIPLHDHPGMTVFNKLLFGSMHVKSYDWVVPAVSNASTSSSPMRLAQMKANGVFTAPCKTSVLFPTTGGNIHTFTALTPCVVLDVFGPPYSSEDGRDCTYYKEFPCSRNSDARIKAERGKGKEKEEEKGEEDDDNDSSVYGWLKEIGIPRDLKLEGLPYFGPQIVVDIDS